jgi:hypothetical protein
MLIVAFAFGALYFGVANLQELMKQLMTKHSIFPRLGSSDSE